MGHTTLLRRKEVSQERRANNRHIYAWRVVRKKVVGEKLTKHLASQDAAAPRRRNRGYDPVSPIEALAMLAERDWAQDAWIAHGGALHGLLYLDRARFDAAVARRVEMATGGDVQDSPRDIVVEEIAGGLVERAMVLSRAVYARGGTPVFIESVSRLVGTGLEEHDEWLARLIRRVHIVDGETYLREVRQRGLGEWEALAMAAYLCETTTDDLAAVCETTRGAVLSTLWDEWNEDVETSGWWRGQSSTPAL